MISIYDSRITYCAMEIQRLAAILRDSFIELSELQKYSQLHENIAKCIEEIEFWSNPLVTCLCYEKDPSTADTANEDNDKPVIMEAKDEKTK